MQNHHNYYINQLFLLPLLHTCKSSIRKERLDFPLTPWFNNSWQGRSGEHVVKRDVVLRASAHSQPAAPGNLITYVGGATVGKYLHPHYRPYRCQCTLWNLICLFEQHTKGFATKLASCESSIGYWKSSIHVSNTNSNGLVSQKMPLGLLLKVKEYFALVWIFITCLLPYCILSPRSCSIYRFYITTLYSYTLQDEKKLQ